MSQPGAQFVDSHAHLDDDQFDRDRDAVIERARAAGVTSILTVGVNLASSRAAIALAATHVGVFAAVGVHPHFAKDYQEATTDQLRLLAGEARVVAIGEIGLDYYRERSPRDEQREAFARQLRLAGDLDLPVVVHDRDAHEDVLGLIAAEAGTRSGRVRGVMHCFSGDSRLAAQVIALGMHVSFAGPVTRLSHVAAGEVVRAIPPDRLLVETDCPYLTPQAVHGRNEPAYVVHTYQSIAERRAVSIVELARQTKCNATLLFGEKLGTGG